MRHVDRYRLAPVRDARARDERVRRGELASAVGDARTAADLAEKARARLEAAEASLRAARLAHAELHAQPRSHAAAIAMAERWCAVRRRQLADAITAHARALAEKGGRDGAVDQAAATLARARADREVIERHFERWRADRARAAERRSD
jgi:hypothetical protein